MTHQRRPGPRVRWMEERFGARYQFVKGIKSFTSGHIAQLLGQLTTLGPFWNRLPHFPVDWHWINENLCQCTWGRCKCETVIDAWRLLADPVWCSELFRRSLQWTVGMGSCRRKCLPQYPLSNNRYSVQVSNKHTFKEPTGTATMKASVKYDLHICKSLTHPSYSNPCLSINSTALWSICRRLSRQLYHRYQTHPRDLRHDLALDRLLVP